MIKSATKCHFVKVIYFVGGSREKLFRFFFRLAVVVVVGKTKLLPLFSRAEGLTKAHCALPDFSILTLQLQLSRALHIRLAGRAFAAVVQNANLKHFTYSSLVAAFAEKMSTLQ